MARNRTGRAAALAVGSVILLGGTIAVAGPAAAEVKPIDCGVANGRGVSVYTGTPGNYREVGCYGYTGSAPNSLSVWLQHTSAVGSGVNTGYTNYYTSDNRDKGARLIPFGIARYEDRNSTTYSVNIWS